MEKVPWYETSLARKLGSTLLLVFWLVVVGPDVVRDLADGVTLWDALSAAAWLVLAYFAVAAVFRHWFRGNRQK